MEGRAIEHQQRLSPGMACLLRRLREPGVFANDHTQSKPLMLEHERLGAGREIALLVEHVVVGQRLLGIAADAAPGFKHAGRIDAAVWPGIGMAHDHTQAWQIGQRCGQVIKCPPYVAQKRRTQQQVFGRIASQRQFRGEDQSTTRRMGFAGGLLDQPAVAGQVSHGRIHLHDRHARLHEPCFLLMD